MFKKLSMKKFTNLVGYSVVCFAYMLTNILLIGAMTETIKINNIYLAAVIGSPILTIFVTQALLKWFFVIENENERKKFERNLHQIYYAIMFAYLITFIICSILGKTFDLLSLILLTLFAILSNFMTPIRFEKGAMIEALIKNENKDAFFQRWPNWLFMIIFCVFLSIHLLA